MTFRSAKTRRALALVGVAGVAAAAAVVLDDGRAPLPAQRTAAPVAAHVDNVVDTSDDRRLVGLADNVFFAEVLAKTGESNEVGVPETQFSARVLDVVKGSLEGTVTVNQFGGLDDGRPVRIHGERPLEPGRTYLLATRTRQDNGWETVIVGDGAIEVRNPQQQRELRRRFAGAREREIPYRPGQ